MIANVLIVENELYVGEDTESDLREIAPEELSAHGVTGFQIAQAKWGSRARELLADAAARGRPYHVVLLDLHLPETERGRYQSIDVGFDLLRFARETRSAKRVIAVSAWDDAILRALRDGVADFVPKRSTKAEETDLPKRFLRVWKTLIDTESDGLSAERIRRLLPQAQLAWATRFSSCFSEFLRAVARTNDDLRAGLSERLELEFDRDRGDPVVRDVERLTDVIKQAKAAWELVTGELRPAEPFGEANLEAGILQALDTLEPCFISTGSGISNRANGSTEVVSYGQDLGLILRELFLGPLVGSSPAGGKIQVEVTTVRDEPWARLIVRDNAPQLRNEEVDAINNGFPLMPDSRFSRAWGLSIIQHTAIRGGARINVATSNSGNEVSYQLPLAVQVIEHADSIRGGERRA